MANKEIRCALVNNGIKQYVLADYLGITETSLSKKLRRELPEAEKKRILDVIDNLVKGEC